jgi:FKBP-type peptidyl-prolyl cis-trans isomerase
MRAKYVAVVGTVLVAAAVTVFLGARVKARGAVALTTQMAKVSYGMGARVGAGLRRQGIEIDPDAVARGLSDALAGKDLLMTQEEIAATMTALQGDVKQKHAIAAREAAEARQKQGEAFLAENAKREGVVTLPSGLQYKVVEMGDGKKPTEGDTVVCHYRGALVDGTEFESTTQRGAPATFQVSRVIAGWKEALPLMPVGSKWQLFVPPELAYGQRGAGRKIGPNETLVFDVELVAIKDPSAKEASAPARAGVKTASARSPRSR